MEDPDNDSLQRSQTSNSIIINSIKNIKSFLLSTNPQIAKITNSEQNIFFIASFHDEIWEKAKIYFYIHDIGINKNMAIEHSYKSEINKNYESKIYCIDFNGSNLPKSIKLSISFWTSLSCRINEMNIKDYNDKCLKFIFNDISLMNKEVDKFIRYANNQLNNIILNNNNYFLPLDIDKKLDIYIDYLNRKRFEDEEKKIEYKENLASDYIYVFKKNKFKKINFSVSVKLFYLSYENKMIIPFLEFTKDIIYIKDNFKNDFMLNLISLYKNNHNEVFKQFNEFEKIKGNFNSVYYQMLLNDFINTYIVLYEKETIVKEEEIKLKYEDILKRLYTKTDNNLETIKFLIEYFDIFYKIYEEKEANYMQSKYIIENNENNKEIGFDVFPNFRKYYKRLAELQENKKKYIFDFSGIIEKYINLYYNQYYILKTIYETFKNELNSNERIKDKLNNYIHQSGIALFEQGKLTNDKIIDFILVDEIYKSSKNETVLIFRNQFLSKKNDAYKTQKDINILKGLNINSKSDPIVLRMEKDRIFEYFKDMRSEYLKIFCEKITDLKNFGAFYKLLPIKYFNFETTIILRDWIIKHLNTFSDNEKVSFNEEMNIFFSILISKAIETVTKFIETLIDSLGDYNVELFMYFLNNNNSLNKDIKLKLISYFIRPCKDENNYELGKMENLLYFIQHYEKEDSELITLFLDGIETFAFNKDDFISIDKTQRYLLFQELLENKSKFITKQKGEYLNAIKEICAGLIYKLKKADFLSTDMMNVKMTIKEPNLTERIKECLIFLSELNCYNIKDIDNESKLIYSCLDKKISKLISNLNNLSKVTHFLEEFFKNDREKMKEKENIEKLVKKLLESKLENVITSEEINSKLKSYEKLIKESIDNLNKKDNSYLFKEIYKANKKRIIENPKYLLEETNKNFNSAIELILENPDEIQDNPFIKYYYEIGYKDDSILDKEINWLINYKKLDINEKDKINFLISLKLLINKQNIISVIRGIIYLNGFYEKNIEQTFEEEAFFNKLKNYLKDLSKNISSNQIQIIIDSIRANFPELSFDNSDKNYKIFILPFLNEINNNQEVFYFLKELKADGIKELKEFFLESDEDELFLTDIDEFIKVVRFLDKEIALVKSSFELIRKFFYGILDKEKFGFYFNVIKKYNRIKHLIDKFIKKEKGVLTIIRDLMNNSTFFLKLNTTKNIYELNGHYEKKNPIDKEKVKTIIIKSEELDDYYQRVFIFINIIERDPIVRKFISFHRGITKIKQLSNLLFIFLGYPNQIEIEFKINQNNCICYYNSKEYQMNQLILDFRNLEEKNWKYLLNIMSQYEEIRLFYGRQYYLINNCIKNKNYNEIKNLISCQANGLISKFSSFDRIEVPIYDEYENMINNIIKFIQDQFKYNGIKIQNIFDKNKILSDINDVKSKNNYKGIYFYGSSIEEYDILNIYSNITGSWPFNTNILLCNADISLIEIYSFINRAICCKVNCLFMIVIRDSFPSSKKSILINYLKKVQDNFQRMMSCLVIFFNLHDNEFHQNILKIRNIKLLNPHCFQEYIKIGKRNVNVKIISSKICGLGKSTFINNKKKKNGDIIYLPIGGDFTQNDIIEILSNTMQSNYKDSINYVLHIDLGQTNDIELVKDFLFKLLILNKCEINENVIYFKSNFEIYIELSNNFNDYLTTYKVLNFFEEIKIPNKFQIYFTKEIKLVSSILKRYENNDILSSNIDTKKEINISEKECQDLILKYLGINNPNLYQINSFIKVLSCEFEKFNTCFGFEPTILRENAQYMYMTQQEALNLRKYIITSLIKITKYFTVGPYENLIKSQEGANIYMNSDYPTKDKYINNLLNIKIDSITYDDIKPSLVVFNNDGNSVTIITSCNENEEEFKNLEKLYNSQNIEYQKQRNRGINDKDCLNQKLKNLKNLDYQNIFNILLNFLNVNGLSKEQIKNIVGSYVYTADNFIKVVLILLRIRAGIPVIMMGETGCGKTTLIEMAYNLINKGNSQIKKLNIHSGTNDKDIINFINKISEEIKLEDELLLIKKNNDFNEYSDNEKYEYIKRKSKEEISKEFQEEINTRSIWVFFDEINTCNSIDLLSEIICKHTCRGKPIDKRLVFIAACNPYRPLLKEKKMDSILFHQNAKKKKLVYSVNPLKHSLLNYVFNFGSLKIDDEKKYIESMTKDVVMPLLSKNYDIKNDNSLCDELIQKIIDCVSLSQIFMKNNNDVSVVSLREVHRFLFFFSFFNNFILERNKNDDKFNEMSVFNLLKDEIVNYYINKSYEYYCECSIILSLFICYYLRLPDKESRKNYEDLIDSKKYFKNKFMVIPNLEMEYVINSFLIPKGIAKNQALKENLFSALYCCMNKIPLIICGKPGRSKTLCIQILQNSLRGKGSSSYLCKLFPELIIHKIQGSLNTKAEDVISCFEKARKSQKETIDSLNMVLMDEMGLAEISHNNPLKVIHYELENESNKVPFIGISNWSLDASKMNRVIYIVVQEPDEEDLILTAKSIVKSYEDENTVNFISKYEKAFVCLSKAFYRYIEDKKEKNEENKLFHGLRDFYSLNKTLIVDIIKKENLLRKEGNIDQNELFDICLRNIERNFGGLDNSINEFKYYFYKIFNANIKYDINSRYELLKCLKDSIYDSESRYLLMISDSSLGLDILNYMLEEINNGIKTNKEENIKKSRRKQIKILLGSKFKSDEKNKYYCDDILYKIKYQMETENILILKDLEVIYPSLYELFNRNFIDLQGVKFARLGSSKSLSLVNDNFKVIVLVDQNNIPKEDPPFLNRFEKHIISFTNILNDDLVNFADEIFSILKNIITFYLNFFDDKKKIKLLLNKNIKFINNEEVRGLVYMAHKEGFTERHDIILYILNKIVPSFTEDLIIIIHKFNFKVQYNFYYKNIIDIYKKNYFPKLKSFIEKTKEKISIIYTFSNIDDNILENENDKINNEFFKEEINIETLKEIRIKEINSLNDLDKEIINYISENIYNLCIIKFTEKDLVKLNPVYNSINEYILNLTNLNINDINENKNKLIIILIHLSRVIDKNLKDKNDNNNNDYISFLSPINHYFIDNINNKCSNFLNLLDSTNEEILLSGIDNNDTLLNKINNVLRFFKYIITNEPKQKNDIFIIDDYFSNNNINRQNINEEFNNFKYKEDLKHEIHSNKGIIDIIKQALLSLFKNEDDILVKIYNNHLINEDDDDFLDTLNIHVNERIEVNLIKLIYLFEQNQIFTALLSNKKIMENKLIMKEINNYIENIYNINTNKLNLNGININNKIEINITFGIKIPFLQKIINENIFNFIKIKIASDYIKKEGMITFKKIILDEDIEIEKSQYIKGIQELNNNLKNEIYKYDFLINILKSGNIELIRDLFSDCFHIFLMRSNKFNNNYNILIGFLDIIIQLRLKTRINNDLNTDFCLKGKKIELETSFLNLYINKDNKKIDDINEINLNDRNINENIDDDNFYIDVFVNVINFIESYSQEIYCILEVFDYLYKSNYSKNLIGCFRDMIKDNKVNMEVSERNPPYTHINKISFFYVIENLLTYMINIFGRKDFLSMYDYYKESKCFLINLFKLEKRFLLFSKEIFNYTIIINIFEYYEKSDKEKVAKEYEKIIRKIVRGGELLLSRNYEFINSDLLDINNSLKLIFGEYSENYSELMNLILLNRYKLIDNKILRTNIIRIIIPQNPEKSNKKLIEKSYSLISRILGKVEPKYIKVGKDVNLKKEKMLSFIKSKQDFEIRNMLNIEEYSGLNEIILYYFENSCKKYFDKIKSSEKDEKIEQKLCEGISKIYLKEVINFLKELNNKKDEKSLNILGKYLSIAYIKRYLEIYVDILINNNCQYLSERKEINKILFLENILIVKEIKFYTLKLCLIKKNNNYDALKKFFKDDRIFEFHEYFKEIDLEKSDSFFFCLLPKSNDQNDFDFYKSYFYEQINNKIFIGEQNPQKSFHKAFNNRNTSDIIYTYLYFLLFKSFLTKEKDNEIMDALIRLTKKDEEQDFLRNIFHENNFNSIIVPKLEINQNYVLSEKIIYKFEILLYALRFVFDILSEKNNKNFYYRLLTNNFISTIQSNMIPGKLCNSDNLINSFQIIKYNFQKNPDYGGYLCSCGYHYSIDFCTFPIIEFNCPICGKIIGGKNHHLYRREGHKRIFYNIQYKNYYTSINYADKDVPYILLEDLENEIKQKKNSLFKGLKQESKEFFLERRTRIRDISYITFRILNFILHGFIFYANATGKIDDNYLNENLIEDMTCFDIMEKDWEIIDQELKIKQIPNVQIFMNTIFDEVILQMKKQKLFEKDINLNNFELAIDKIIEEKINDKNAINEYIKYNNSMTQNEIFTHKSIILGKDIYNMNIYKEYPDMKYFCKTKLPEINDFEKDFKSLEENKEVYPIINFFLDKNSNIKYLSYLPTINKLCNHVINYCSYRFSREEAKVKLIKNEIKIDDKLIDDFIDIYNKLRPIIKMYECHEFKDKNGNLYFNDLRNEQILSNFCVDIGEFNYGMVLASLYKEMINWQNQFINIVLNSKNKYHNNYSDLFKQKIMIQDCNENDIVKFPSNDIINEIIVKNSCQKNYGIIYYDFNLIEEELASIILPSIKKFYSDKDDNYLRYVIYQYEGFRGNKSNIITNFIEKYSVRELNNEELRIILNFKNKYEKKEEKKMINILFSLQILIDIILEKNYNKNDLLSKIIENNNNDGSLDILKPLFDKNRELFKVDSLISIFNILEIICWEKIKKNLTEDYLMDINEIIKDKYDKLYKEGKFIIFSREKLSIAIRRFISRYLSGKRGQNEINEKNNLKYYLSKQELWDQIGIINNEQFDKELNKLFSDDGSNDMIYVGQAVNLYEHLGGDKSLINEYYKQIGQIGELKEENLIDNNNILFNKDKNYQEKEDFNKMPNYYNDEGNDDEDNNDYNDYNEEIDFDY